MEAFQAPSAPPSNPPPSAESHEETLRLIDLALIDESPTNPRKHFDAQQLAELATDLAANGLLQPVRVRPLGARFELVIGARRFRAAKSVGWSTIRAIVREYSDREVLEAQISENGQREDVHPLEEADAFEALHRVHRVPVEEIAARIGSKPAFVRQRLQLAALCPEAREAFLAGKVTAGVAQLVARLPVADYQVEALATLTKIDWNGQMMTVAAAGQWIRNRYHLRLATAPFDTMDATLTTAGACDPCPKRSGAQPDLFADETSPDVCTDPKCWQAKAEATWQKSTAAARAEGKPVLSVEESAKVVSYGGVPTAGFARLTDKPWDFGGKKSWEQLLRKALPETVIVRDPDGKPVELVRPEDLKAAIKTVGLKKEKASTTGNTSTTRRGGPQHDQKTQEKLDLAVATAVAHAAMDKNDVYSRASWQFVAKAFLASFNGEGISEVAKRRNLVKGEYPSTLETEKALIEEIECLATGGCRGIIAELVISFARAIDDTGLEDLVLAYCKVDRAAVEKKVLAELAGEKKPESPAKSVKASTVAGKATKKAVPKATPKATPAKKPAAKKTKA